MGGKRVRGERERGRQMGRKSEHKMDIEKRIQSSKVITNGESKKCIQTLI